MIRLDPVFTWRVIADAATPIGAVDAGERLHNRLPSVVVEGERLRATALGAGGDWFLTTRDGWGRIDVRMLIQTDDGAVIDVRYQGWVEPTEALQRAIEARVPTSFEDQSIRTVWRLETGDERYAWLNRAILVGAGRLLPGPGDGQLGMEHRVYQLA